ncbi:MAG: LysM peptidoglycan-binding domain-containing protein [Chloroflexi bacterium]|nr:LysM peptidoglycan-binding domain-containing protein [Chloroflexota bacterium]
MPQTFNRSRKRAVSLGSVMLVVMMIATFASASTASAATCTWTHRVRFGDTLGQIAHYYNTTVNAILGLNPQITDYNLIFWGTDICVSDTATPPPPPDFQGTYKVIFGDTLGNIAFTFGANLGDLVRVNGIGNPDVIFAGETLKVPAAP